MSILAAIVVLLGLLAVGIPVAISLLAAGSVGLIIFGGGQLFLGVLGAGPGSALVSYELLTVPMFLFMAELMVASGISHTLFDAIAVWTRRMRGGLGAATAITGAAFGAISGSSAAAAATLSSSSVPAMLRDGYDRRFATGIVAVSGALAMLIPPSIAIIFYGLLSGESIAELLIAGVVPRVLVTLTIAITIRVMISINPTLAPVGSKTSWIEKAKSLKVAGPFVFLFGMVTGLIYTGIATPVEASAIGALGAFLLTLKSGRLNWATLKRALVRTCATSAMIGLIIACASVFGTFLTITGATQELVMLASQSGWNPYVILMFIVILYLILGCFLDQISILILTVPVTLPLIVSLGFDPIWFGIIVILLAEIGIVTPPLGLNVFIVAKMTQTPVEDVFRGVGPHVVALILLTVLMIAFPSLILWLPDQMN